MPPWKTGAFIALHQKAQTTAYGNAIIAD